MLTEKEKRVSKLLHHNIKTIGQKRGTETWVEYSEKHKYTTRGMIANVILQLKEKRMNEKDFQPVTRYKIKTRYGTFGPYQPEVEIEEAKDRIRTELGMQRMPQGYKIIPEDEEIVEEADSPPEAKEKKEATPLEESLSGFIHEVVGEKSVSEETVTRIVKRELDKRKPRTVQVKLPDKEPKKIDSTHVIFEQVLKMAHVGPLLLVGPTGCGKTTLAEQLAEALDVPFFFNGAIWSDHKLMGFIDAGGTYHTTPFRRALEEPSVYLFDELDASSPQAVLAFNAALANGLAEFPDEPTGVDRHPESIIIASANTWGTGPDREYVGRNQLDAATLERFTPLEMDYDREIESQLARDEWCQKCWSVREKCDSKGVRHVISTRRILWGEKMLQAGMSMQETVDLQLKRNLDDSTWEKVRP